MQHSPEPSVGGPYVAAAVFCEKVLKEADGVVSLIRIVDRTTVAISGKDAPAELPPVTLDLNLFLSFKAGFARGKMPIEIEPSTPSGHPMPMVSTAILLEGEDRGVNLILQTKLEVKEEGLFWFDVRLDGQLVTRVPYRVLYQRMTHQS